MFTGIVEEIGTVQGIQNGHKSVVLTIGGREIFRDLQLGDSVAVNGVCLTVSSRNSNCFTADVMPETIRRSSLGQLKICSHVNLERAMPVNGRFGGHLVSGHIDGMGIIAEKRKEDNAVWYTIRTEGHILRYIVEKGSVAVDGVSLTVAGMTDKAFMISVIPHTRKTTALMEKKVGEAVNIENDIFGKYIAKFLEKPEMTKGCTGLTKEFLMQCGYV